jgi:RNase P subunit RPR2
MFLRVLQTKRTCSACGSTIPPGAQVAVWAGEEPVTSTCLRCADARVAPFQTQPRQRIRQAPAN